MNPRGLAVRNWTSYRQLFPYLPAVFGLPNLILPNEKAVELHAILTFRGMPYVRLCQLAVAKAVHMILPVRRSNLPISTDFQGGPGSGVSPPHSDRHETRYSFRGTVGRGC